MEVVIRIFVVGSEIALTLPQTYFFWGNHASQQVLSKPSPRDNICHTTTIHVFTCNYDVAHTMVILERCGEQILLLRTLCLSCDQIKLRAQCCLRSSCTTI